MIAVLPSAGCDAIGDATSPRITAQEYLFNFENSINGWELEGRNVDPAGTDWSIAARGSVPRRSGRAVAFRLDSHSHSHSQSAGARIWMEREFVLASNTSYEVTLEFEFASADWGPDGHWFLLVGANAGKVDLDTHAFFTTSTANGATVDDGFRWRTVRLPTRIRSGADGRVRVAFGIESASRRDATYYLDELAVKFRSE